MENMEKDLVKIDATKKTEDFNKQMESVSNASVDDYNELASLMDEPIQDTSSEDRKRQVEEFTAQFELGHTVALKRPITSMTPTGPQTISEVAFSNELEARHIQKLPMNTEQWTFAHQLSLIGACTGLKPAELLQLKTYDVMPLMEVAVSFFSVGPKIGS